VTIRDTDIVSALQSALAEAIGPERFALWFDQGAGLDFDGQVVSIGLPSRFLLDWIRTAFRGEIETACRRVLGSCPQVRFSLQAPSHSKAPAGSGPGALKTHAHVGSKQAGESQPGGGAGNASGTWATARATGTPPECNAKATSAAAEVAEAAAPQAAVATAPGSSPASTGPCSGSPNPRPTSAPSRARPPQQRFASLKTFVVGPSNRVARASAEMAAHQPGHFSPLLIHGPTSVGKTHLLQGIWSEARRSPTGGSAVYLSAEQFTSYYVEAVRGSGLPSFRQKYREVQLLIIDDLQFFRGKRSTLVELLYTVDTLLRQRRQLVLAADRPPSELTDLGPELMARLESGVVVQVDPPDHGTRLGIVGELARRMGLHVPDDVQRLLASRLRSHARELSGALCRLKATSTALGKPITVPLAEEALADMFRNSGRLLRLGDIQKAVCEVFGVDADSLQSGRRTRYVSHPRMLAMWLARKHTRAALTEIGDFFGRRSHSTVISAQKKVDHWIAAGRAIETRGGDRDVDDAIRQVEQLLLAG
jgi:chromosomal replication initiator protein